MTHTDTPHTVTHVDRRAHILYIHCVNQMHLDAYGETLRYMQTHSTRNYTHTFTDTYSTTTYSDTSRYIRGNTQTLIDTHMHFSNSNK